MYAQRTEKTLVVKQTPLVVELGPDIHAKIGVQLRVIYAEVVDQGVPERFIQMLKRLDAPNCEIS